MPLDGFSELLMRVNFVNCAAIKLIGLNLWLFFGFVWMTDELQESKQQNIALRDDMENAFQEIQNI